MSAHLFAIAICKMNAQYKYKVTLPGDLWKGFRLHVSTGGG